MRLIQGKTYYKKDWYNSWRSMMEWAEIKGINRSTLNNRLWRGMSPEKALSEVNFYGSSN